MSGYGGFRVVVSGGLDAQEGQWGAGRTVGACAYWAERASGPNLILCGKSCRVLL